MFVKLKITKWRQYDDIDIRFHDRLTLLTGANGAGKTTLLNIINKHFGWHISFVATPVKDSITGKIQFESDTWKSFLPHRRFLALNYPQGLPSPPPSEIIGEILYSNGLLREIVIPQVTSSSFNVDVNNQVPQKGVAIPSHRPVFKQQIVTQIPTAISRKQDIFNNYNSVRYNRFSGAQTQHSESYHIKQSLISLALFGWDSPVLKGDPEAAVLFNGFVEILKIVLPPKLGFYGIEIRSPDVILLTKSGEFSMDSASGGVSSIIDLAWTIYLYNDEAERFTVTLDEPENHLHPEMQKTLLPNFLQAFPNVQFIVATHNPFIISSVSDSNLYVLNYNELNKVYSQKLDYVDKSGTANEILRDVLGLETTMPKWVATRLQDIVQRYASSDIDAKVLKDFKNELKSNGLENYVSDSVIDLIEDSKKK